MSDKCTVCGEHVPALATTGPCPKCGRARHLDREVIERTARRHRTEQVVCGCLIGFGIAKGVLAVYAPTPQTSPHAPLVALGLVALGAVGIAMVRIHIHNEHR